jgi:hypothetical protein
VQVEEAGVAPRYVRHTMDCDAPVADVLRLAGFSTDAALLDVTDSYICGVRRVGFTTLADMRHFTVHLAPAR